MLCSHSSSGSRVSTATAAKKAVHRLLKDFREFNQPRRWDRLLETGYPEGEKDWEDWEPAEERLVNLPNILLPKPPFDAEVLQYSHRAVLGAPLSSMAEDGSRRVMGRGKVLQTMMMEN